MAKKTIQTADATKVVRDAVTQLQTCIGSISDSMDDPLKTKWKEVGTELQTILASLPVDGKDDEDKAAEAMPAIMGAVEKTLAHYETLAKDAAEKMQTTLASLPGKVQAEVEAKVKAGEFITKADHDKAISDATTAATTAARAAVLAETKRVGERRTLLTTASIPVPSDDILMKEDKEFGEAQEAAKKRIEELKPFGLAPERQVTLAWNTDEASYQNTISLMKDVAAKASKGAGANGFIKRDGSGKEDKPKQRSIGLC